MSSTVAASLLITRHRVLFFLAGVLIPWISLWIGLQWPHLYERLFHEGFNYAWQPLWYRIAGDIIGYLPLLSLGFLIALRIFYSRAVKPISYAAGLACFYAVFIVLMVYAFSQSPF
jgi:hypothetical protein